MDRDETRAADSYIDRPNRLARAGEAPTITSMSTHLTNSEEMAARLFVVLNDIHRRLGSDEKGDGLKSGPENPARVDPLLYQAGELSRRLKDCLLSAERVLIALGG